MLVCHRFMCVTAPLKLRSIATAQMFTRLCVISDAKVGAVCLITAKYGCVGFCICFIILLVYIVYVYAVVVTCWFCGQFGGETGEQFVVACSDFCRDQSHAQDVLRLRRRKDPKLALFLQVKLLVNQNNQVF